MPILFFLNENVLIFQYFLIISELQSNSLKRGEEMLCRINLSRSNFIVEWKKRLGRNRHESIWFTSEP
jgi:hypothetical protein